MVPIKAERSWLEKGEKMEKMEKNGAQDLTKSPDRVK